MARIQITVCTGTTCYVMGAGNLLSIADHVGSDIRDVIDIKGSTCLELCKEGRHGGAPFVKVNDTVIADATINKIVEAIRKEL